MPGIDRKFGETMTERLADYLSTLAYETLPPEVITAVKHLLLDTLGTTLAANTLGVGCREVVELALMTKSSAESTLLGFGCKVAAPMAAFANGAMSHALNYDASGADGAHLGVAALASPFAVAELVGGVSGKEFLCGVVASAELTARLASAIAAIKGENSSALKGQLLAYFGAAAGSGRIMKLTAAQMHSALGIALMQAAGSMQVVFDGDPPAKAIYGAFPNQAGVITSLLSKQGLGAELNVFDGRAGLFGMYYGSGVDPMRLVSDLGNEFRMLKVRFKPWPTSGVLHPFIEAALQVSANDNFDVRNIQRILIRGGDHLRPFCEPDEERKRPRNAAAAANSVFFAVAKTLLNKKLGLGDFTSAGLCQDRVSRLVDRMTCSVEAGLGRAAIIEVTTFNHGTYSNEASTGESVSGELSNYDQLVSKFYDCAQHAASKIPREKLDRVIETIECLETVPDISSLASLLTEES